MTHPCPKCRRLLEQSGEIEFLGEVFPVFSCDHCMRKAEFGGEMFDVYLTFALTPDGRMVDPEAPDEPYRWN